MSDAEAERAVSEALGLGYRLVDTAANYRNEDGVGRGVARSGVKCGPGVKQVPWSPYAPPCVPQFSANNGGVTSPGVSNNTITLVFRRTLSAEEKAAFAASQNH